MGELVKKRRIDNNSKGQPSNSSPNLQCPTEDRTSITEENQKTECCIDKGNNYRMDY